MKNFKYDRLATDMQKAITMIMSDSESEDLQFISIVEVELTKDLQDAKIFISTPKKISDEELLNIMKIKTPYIKKELAQRIKIRKIPNIIFKIDSSLDNYNRIDEIIASESKKLDRGIKDED